MPQPPPNGRVAQRSLLRQSAEVFGVLEATPGHAASKKYPVVSGGERKTSSYMIGVPSSVLDTPTAQKSARAMREHACAICAPVTVTGRPCSVTLGGVAVTG